jgi:hypothetical protein
VSIIDPDLNDELFVEISWTEGQLSFPKSVLTHVKDIQIDALYTQGNFARFMGNASLLNQLLDQMMYTANNGTQYSGRLEYIHFVAWSLPFDDDSTPSTMSTSIKIIVTTS